MKNFFKEFETFAIRGNALDLAVGVVIGAAFGQVTTALANNILTPVIGVFLGGFNFATLAIPLRGDAVLGYGLFLQAVINFIIIAFALFLLVRSLNQLLHKRKEEEMKPAENPELKVLMEIRDALERSKV
jgi:large conductance mechanosensitive channel